MRQPVKDLVFVGRVEAACIDRLTQSGVPGHVINRLQIIPTVVSPIMLTITMDGAPEWIWSEPFTSFPSEQVLNQILMLA